jgi:hypothetical protein
VKQTAERIARAVPERRIRPGAFGLDVDLANGVDAGLDILPKIRVDDA